MIRTLGVFAWLRFRLAVNAVRAARSLGRLERMSRAAQFVVPIVIAAFLIPATAGLAFIAFLTGVRLPQAGNTALIFDDLGGAIGLTVTVTLLFSPLVRSVEGGGSSFARLLLLPVSRRVLHLGDVLGAVLDPWLAMLLPALLACLPFGLASQGALALAALALAAALLLLLALASLRVLVGFLLSLLLGTRRRTELVYLMLVALFTLLPLFVERPGTRGQPGTKGPPLVRPIEPGKIFPAWSSVLPTQLYVRAVGRTALGDAGSGLAHLAGLAAVAAALYEASWRAFNRVADRGGAGAAPRRAGPVRVPRFALPGVPERIGALAVAHARLQLRTVRGKSVLFLTPLILLLAGWTMPSARVPGSSAAAWIQSGPALALLGVIFSFLSLQELTVNQFALDRGGFAREVLGPLAPEEQVAGRALGTGALASGSWLVCLGVARWLRPELALAQLAAVFLCGVSTYALFAPVAAVLSAVLPKAGDPGRLGGAGNVHPLASIVGSLIALGLLVPALGLFVAASAFLPGARWTLGLLAGWTALALLLSLPLFRLAGDVLEERRENVFLVSQAR